MKTSAAIREYLIEIEVRKYTPKTIRGYRNSLNLFLRFCEQEAHIQDVEEINLAVVRQYSALMSQKGRKGSACCFEFKQREEHRRFCSAGICDHQRNFGSNPFFRYSVGSGLCAYSRFAIFHSSNRCELPHLFFWRGHQAPARDQTEHAENREMIEPQQSGARPCSVPFCSAHKALLIPTADA